MRCELSGEQASELLAALKALRPALPEELIKRIMDREQRVSLGPDLDFLDYAEIWPLPGSRVWLEFDIRFDEEPDAACDRVANEVRSQGVDLARAGGTIISFLSPSGHYSQVSRMAKAVKSHLHRASVNSFGCSDGGNSQECISCLIVVTGINGLEPFTFVGPDEDFSRRFERLNGTPPMLEIPAFLRPKQIAN